MWSILVIQQPELKLKMDLNSLQLRVPRPVATAAVPSVTQHKLIVQQPSTHRSRFKQPCQSLTAHGKHRCPLPIKPSSSFWAFVTWRNKSKIIAVSISSAQPETTSLSDQIYVGSDFLISPHRRPLSAHGTPRFNLRRNMKSSRKSSFKTSRIPHSAFSMELPWRRKPTKSIHDTSALNTCISASRKRQKLVSPASLSQSSWYSRIFSSTSSETLQKQTT